MDEIHVDRQAPHQFAGNGPYEERRDVSHLITVPIAFWRLARCQGNRLNPQIG